MAQLQGRCASAREIGGTGGGDPSDKIFLLFQNEVLVVWQKWSIMNVKNSEYFSIVVDEMKCRFHLDFVPFIIEPSRRVFYILNLLGD